MGVPSFYRYLLDTFGRDIELKIFDRHLAHESIHSRYVEFNNAREPGSSFYKDADLNVNISPVQFDNLYLDMNGLIHPCAHPESGPKPVDEQEMLFNVMMYLDRLVYAIRPTTLLFLSVDGCAPRAKMNQQRGRRFISAKESQISKMVHTQQLEFWTEKMKRFLNTEDDVNIKELYSELFEDKKPSWDHNVITPGTLFMEKITTILHFYAAYKINTDPLFKNLKVIVSDASNPGEGEHKILSYIRQQRNDPKYKSQTKHLIHALDADLIMLSLASHETQLYILRENNMDDKVHHLDRELFIVDIPTLKVRLCKEMVKQIISKDKPLSSHFNYETLIDDFVFLCMLCGNDFLPNLPGLSIRDGSINYIVDKYLDWCVLILKKEKHVPYLTDGAKVNVDKVIQFLSVIGDEVDEHYLKKSKAAADQYVKTVQRAQKFIHGQTVVFDQPFFGAEVDFIVNQYREFIAQGEDKQEIVEDDDEETKKPTNPQDAPKNAAEKLERIKKLMARQTQTGVENYIVANTVHEKQFSTDYYNQEAGWKDEYYQKKFELDTGAIVEKTRKQVCKDYIQGLEFVWKYYSAGVPSWLYYYPHHFGPVTSDFSLIHGFEPQELKLGAPQRPFSQLMSVMPKKSAESLPKSYQNLMLNSKRIAKFYPDEFRRDLDSKTILWKAVPLLPFIDGALLKSEIDMIKNEVSDAEKKRNQFGHTIIYFNKDENEDMMDVYNEMKTKTSHVITRHSFTQTLHASHFFSTDKGKLSGYMYDLKKYPEYCQFKLDESITESPIIEYTGEVDIEENCAALCVYFEPCFPVDLSGKLLPSEAGGQYDANTVAKAYVDSLTVMPTDPKNYKGKHKERSNKDATYETIRHKVISKRKHKSLDEEEPPKKKSRH